MAANYGRTKPVDPLWYRADRSLNLTCACGHRVTVKIGALARKHRLDMDQSIYQIVPKLRCSACGARGPAVSLPGR